MPLNKVSCQGSHFIFGLLGVPPAAPPPPAAPRPPAVRRVPHGGVSELHQVLEHRVTEHTARVLGGAGQQRSPRLVEVHGHQGRLAHLTALCCHLVDSGCSDILHRCASHDGHGAEHQEC